MSKQDILDYFSDINYAYNDSTRLDTLSRMLDELVEQAASPWHRVEEPPKEHGKYPVCFVKNGQFFWEEAQYCFYQDGDKWTVWSEYQGDDVEIDPDYWMPIEPPKEDA